MDKSGAMPESDQSLTQDSGGGSRIEWYCTVEADNHQDSDSGCTSTIEDPSNVQYVQ